MHVDMHEDVHEDVHEDICGVLCSGQAAEETDEDVRVPSKGRRAASEGTRMLVLAPFQH